MRRRIGVAITAAVVGSVLLTALPAAAETNGVFDPEGDAPAFLDITSVEVHDQHAALVVKAIVPGFDPAHLTYPNRPLAGGDDWGTLFLRIRVKGVDGSAWTPTWRSTLGRFLVEVGPSGATNPVDDVLLSRQRGSTSADVACAGMKADLRVGVITATIPQSCFGRVRGAGAGAVTVKAVMRGNVGPRSVEDRAVTTPWVHKAKR